MKIVYRNKLIIGILLILAVSQISAVRVQPRRSRQASDDNDLNLPQIVNNIGDLPVVGPIIVSMIKAFANTVERIDHMTNGVLGRLLGGALPCEVSDQGIVCSGISEKGGVFGMVESALNEMPLPQVVREAILMLIRMFFNPIVDTLFGGLRRPTAQSIQ